MEGPTLTSIPIRFQPGTPLKVATVTATHAHPHTHVAEMPADPFKSYSTKAAMGIGVVHGIGADSEPDPALRYRGGCGVRGRGHRVMLAFLVGLVAANSVVAVATALGFADRSRMPRLYFGIALVAALFSLTLGSRTWPG